MMKSYEQRSASITKKVGIRRTRKKRLRKIIGVSSLVAVSCTAVAIAVVLSISDVSPNNLAQSEPSKAEPTHGAMQEEEQSTPVPIQNIPRLQISDAYINYSEFVFNYEGEASYIEMADTAATFCLAYPFSQDLLSECNLIAKATILKVEYGMWDCPEPEPAGSDTETLVYTLKLDKIFYTDLDVEEGDEYVIEQAVFGGSLSDLEFGLKVGGQYFLPIAYQGDRYSKSQYGLVYPFEPMIERTANGAYLFSGRWPALFSEHTAIVNIDIPMVNQIMRVSKEMFVRADDEFENDFQRIAEYYCSDEYIEDINEQGDANTYTGSSLTDEVIRQAIPDELCMPSGFQNSENNAKGEVFVTVSFENSEDELFLKITGEEYEMYYGEREKYRDYRHSETLSFYMAKREGRTEYVLYPVAQGIEYMTQGHALKAAAGFLKSEGISVELENYIVAQPSVHYDTVNEYNDTMTPCWYICFEVRVNDEQNLRKMWIIISAQTGKNMGYRLG